MTSPAYPKSSASNSWDGRAREHPVRRPIRAVNPLELPCSFYVLRESLNILVQAKDRLRIHARKIFQTF